MRSRKGICSRGIAVLLSMLLMVISVGCSSNASKTYEEKEQMLDSYMDEVFMSDYNQPSISILVIDGGKKVYNKSFGIANVDTMEVARPDTNYRIASLTKMFTAMSVMILKDKGELDFDMKVQEVLKDFPDYGKDITIRYLLNHTSGVRSYNHEMGVEKYDEINQLLDSDVYDMIKTGEFTYFKPGTIFRYSDTGFVLLGLIVEEVSGKTLSDFMQDEIFTPLGMKNTVAYDKRVDTPIVNRSYGTAYKDGKAFTKDQSFASAVVGDGGIYSSLDDMYIWHKNLYESTLVSEETIKDAYTTRTALNYGYDNCVCGLYMRKNVKNQFEMMHDGGTQGFTSHFLKIPETNQGIIILSNRDLLSICTTFPDKIREIYGFPKETPNGQQRY